MILVNKKSTKERLRLGKPRAGGARCIVTFLKLLLAITCSLFSVSVLGVESQPLEGSFFVSPRYYIDPGPEVKNTHYRIQLEGQSAKELYDLMDVDIKIDNCTQAKSKTVGTMQCFHFENYRGYECSFSIDVKNQKIEVGLVC